MGLKCLFNQETGERSVAGFRSHKNQSWFGMLWKLIALKHTWQRFRLSTFSFFRFAKRFQIWKVDMLRTKTVFLLTKSNTLFAVVPCCFCCLCVVCVSVEPGIYPAILQRSTENLPFGPQQNTSRINKCLVNVSFVKDVLEFTGLKLISSGWSG